MSPAAIKPKKRRRRPAKGEKTSSREASTPAPIEAADAKNAASDDDDEDHHTPLSDPGLSDDNDLDDEDDFDDEDDQRAARPKRAGASAPPSGMLRLLFYVVWVVVLPAGLAVVTVDFLRPDAHEVAVGAIREFVDGQQVPATILLFTVFAVIIWQLRHRLPLAAWCGILLREDIPAGLQGRYEKAAQLLADAQRIMVDNKGSVRKQVKAPLLRKLKDALQKLEDEVDAPTVDRERLIRAHGDAAAQVSDVLGRWHKGEAREYAESIGVAIAVAVVLRLFVIEAFKIPSGSMIPTLMVGDHIFVGKHAYGPLLPRSDSRLYDNLPPERGDVMVFKYPENKKQDFIKRVIALPGDKLEVLNGRPIINGLLLPHCYVGEMELDRGAGGHLYLEHLGEMSYLTMYNEPHAEPSCESDRDCGVARSCRGGICGVLLGPYRVTQRKAWVMGDNRNNSHDSRFWKGGMGAGVPFENIKGRAMFVWWSTAPHRGFTSERMFVNVMGTPKLPSSVTAEVAAGLKECLRKRPSIAASTPPAP